MRLWACERLGLRCWRWDAYLFKTGQLSDAFLTIGHLHKILVS